MSKRMIDRLPDSFNKETDSANARLLGLMEAGLRQAKEVLAAVEKSASLEGAQGGTLDEYGRMMGLWRGAMDDAKYRVLLQAQQALFFVDGSHAGVERAVQNLLGAAEGEVALCDDPDAPAGVRVERLPFAALQRAGFTGKQAMEMISQLLPAGVAITSGHFEGSFAFSALEDEWDETAGFADEAGSMGGTLGYVSGDEAAPPLPL